MSSTSPPAPLASTPKASWRLERAAPTLRDLNTQLGWNFPREAGVETLAGFLLAQLGHIPDPGESVIFEGRRYTVEEMSGRRIARVRVETIGPNPNPPPITMPANSNSTFDPPSLYSGLYLLLRPYLEP